MGWCRFGSSVDYELLDALKEDLSPIQAQATQSPATGGGVGRGRSRLLSRGRTQVSGPTGQAPRSQGYGRVLNDGGFPGG